MQQPHFSLSQVTPPAAEPVTVDYVKSWMRLDSPDHDLIIADLIVSARRMCERWAGGRSFINTTWMMQLDRFPLIPNSQYAPGNPNAVTPVMNNVWPLDPSTWAILLPRNPVSSITGVQYVANDGSTQTLDPSQYTPDLNSEPARIAPAYGSYWPSPRFQPAAIQVTFTAGYGASSAQVPAHFRMAIAALVGHWYDQPNGPSEELPEGVKDMLLAEGVSPLW